MAVGHISVNVRIENSSLNHQLEGTKLILSYTGCSYSHWPPFWIKGLQKRALSGSGDSNALDIALTTRYSFRLTALDVNCR